MYLVLSSGFSSRGFEWTRHCSIWKRVSVKAHRTHLSNFLSLSLTFSHFPFLKWKFCSYFLLFFQNLQNGFSKPIKRRLRGPSLAHSLSYAKLIIFFLPRVKQEGDKHSSMITLTLFRFLLKRHGKYSLTKLRFSTCERKNCFLFRVRGSPITIPKDAIEKIQLSTLTIIFSTLSNRFFTLLFTCI